MDARAGRVTAVLGPTNTGKTHYAIERMLAHRTGVIGLPLRLLAREVYDRIVAARGPSVVALVTGEERIVPPRAAYWVCTVEAMPQGLGCDFAAIDEIQLCADPERGHVFTERLLRTRGLQETVLMGAGTMRGPIAHLVPEARFQRRERFSELVYVGPKKISRMPPRSAIVGFSVENVYAIAELLRRQKGGAAVVMGALSPRTRNAQVAMYQNGDVDYLVATDAIGMGLNLDIRHVAFSSLVKFDGRRMRELFPHELAQIAGRAGRYMQPGTFGTTGEAHALDDGVAQAIQEHRFKPVDRLVWRNDRLEFGSPERLIASLEAAPEDPILRRGREADDLHALRALSDLEGVRARLRDARDVRLLWDVCRIPDFQGISPQEHVRLLERLFGFLREDGQVSADWFARQVRRIDRTDGDIDALSRRLAFIRTWTYVAQRKDWLSDSGHWREATRAVEDRLSDALHLALTARFVDRRTSVLLRRLKMREGLLADIDATGTVTVEGEALGRLEGFRFRQERAASPDEARTLRQAAQAALAPEFQLRADRFYNAPDTEVDFTEQGGLMWGEHAVGKIVRGPEPLKPQVEAFVDDDAGAEVAEKVRRRLQHFVDRKVAAGFEPLLAMTGDEALPGLARGFAFRLMEGFGVLPRQGVAGEVRDLDQGARGALRKHGVRFGQFTVFLPALLKPAPTRLRLVLWGLWSGLDEFPSAPPPGLVTVPLSEGMPEGYWTMAGYRAAGSRGAGRAIRIDMLERLADMIRTQDTRGGFEASPDMLSITGLTLEQFAGLMEGLGYRAERGERPKRRRDPKPAAATEVEAAPAGQETPAAESAQQEEGTQASAGSEGVAAAPEAAAGQSAVAVPSPADAEPAPEGEADTPRDEADATATAPEGDADPGSAGEPVVEETSAPDAEPPDAVTPPEDAEPAPPVEEGGADATRPDGGDDGERDGAAAGERSTGPEATEDGGAAPAAGSATEGEAPDPEAETEAFYTFTWAPRRQNRGQQRRDGAKGARGKEGGRGEGRGKQQGGRPGGKGAGGRKDGRGGKGDGPGGPRTFQSRPERPGRKDRVDPDSPFAALAALKDK
jgi:ATP-dependent RNA helicase SUPV3L1/SUV3